MARNQHAVIWSKVSGQPEKMGDLFLTQDRISFTYTKEYLVSESPGLCLLGDQRIWGDDSVEYPVSERIAVFPRLLSLIPGNNPRNIQRSYYLDLLRAKLGKEPPLGIETEWQLLLMGGQGGIGHIDVFADDRAADKWYQKTSLVAEKDIAYAADSRSGLWRLLKRNVLDESIDLNYTTIEGILGPTPSVGGMIPKLLVSIDISAKNINFYPPASERQSVILKVEPPEYRGLNDLEALCLDIHQQAGFAVPEYRQFSQGGLEFLAIFRFDMVNQRPLPLESLFSVIATGNHHFRETGDILLDELGGIFDRLGQVADLAADTNEQLYRRILMALLTGNGDLHLDNIALLGGLSDCRLSPVYDPAPMRAWPRHNLLSAIPFDPAGFKHHGEYFASLGRSFGLSSLTTHKCIEDALGATSSYAQRVEELKRVPRQQRQQLVKIVQTERKLLASCL